MSKAYRDYIAENPDATRGEVLRALAPKYGPGRTKQSFKDQTDINKILKRAQVKGGLAHVQKYPEATYGEFDQEFGLLEAREQIDKAGRIFGELPAEVRREFNNDALEFVQYAASVPPGELVDRIPAIAEPGNYFPNPVRRDGQGAGAATAPSNPSFSEGASPRPPEPSEPAAG